MIDYNKWLLDAATCGEGCYANPDKLIGVAVDNDEKADWFEAFWKENFPLVKVVDRNKMLKNQPTILMRIRKDVPLS